MWLKSEVCGPLAARSTALLRAPPDVKPLGLAPPVARPRRRAPRPPAPLRVPALRVDVHPAAARLERREPLTKARVPRGLLRVDRPRRVVDGPVRREQVRQSAEDLGAEGRARGALGVDVPLLIAQPLLRPACVHARSGGGAITIKLRITTPTCGDAAHARLSETHLARARAAPRNCRTPRSHPPRSRPSGAARPT